MTAPASPSTRNRNPRGAGDHLRFEIIDAAITLIDQANDAAALTLRGIARQAQISAPSIYRHFADLDAVITAVLARSFEQLTQAMTIAADGRGTPAGPQTPAARLLAGCRAYLDFGWAHPARYRLMFAASGYAANAVDAFTLIEHALRQCVAAGTSASTDPHADTYLLWVAVHGLATLDKPARSDYLRLGPIDRPAALAALVHRLARITVADPPKAG
jgi:AcrR family transcriptional regulator